MEALSHHRCFGGTLGYYRHNSRSTHSPMRFTLFVPPKPTGACVVYLSGLTCTEENFTVKAGAYRVAAELGLMIAAPDTSPRGDHVPDDASISLGKGAGFYLNATEAPWAAHYQMESYIAEELPALLRQEFAVARFGLMGHSMGGHGALTLGQKYESLFRSLSALAPVCTPSKSGWGPATLTAYLGEDENIWKQHDATELMKQRGKGGLPPILIDQGLADEPYQEGRLNPEAFVAACEAVGQPVTYRTHEGYDHGYFFVQSVIDDHVRHHAAHLG